MKLRRKEYPIIEAVQLRKVKWASDTSEYDYFSECPKWLKELIEAGNISFSVTGGEEYFNAYVDPYEKIKPGDFLVKDENNEFRIYSKRALNKLFIKIENEQ